MTETISNINKSYLSYKDNTPLMFLKTSFLKDDRKQALKFFKGKIKNVFLFRDLLLFLNEVVNSRFYRQDLWRLLDPVITCEKEQIMMECFSSCGSIYARVDIFENIFDSYELLSRGTTNVNFNRDFIESLLSLKMSNESFIEVGRDEILLESDNKVSKEKKVKLPERWIKGFLQSQSIISKSKLFYELNSINSKKLILECQKTVSDKEYYLLEENKSLVLKHIRPQKGNYITISGLNRLNLLKRVIPYIEKLKIYYIKENNSTLWLIKTPNANISFSISASIKNGFSGEGESLRNLSLNRDETIDDFILEMIKNLGSFDIEQLSEISEISKNELIQCLENLSINGILGFNSEKQKYFYRVLPFADKLNSRFENSKNILKKSDIDIEEIEKNDNRLFIKGWVQGINSKYYTYVNINNSYIENAQCNCSWFIKNELKRGPCKHILALRFFGESQV